MDFPKSVAGIGLVNGRFVDENPVTGQQGSLIAADWGNQVTDELLNILAEAKKDNPGSTDFDPTEEKSDQVVTAIKSLITNAIPSSLSSWKDIDNKPTYITAQSNITTISATATLTDEQLGTILIDATAGDVALTLPPSATSNKGVVAHLIRQDNSGNKVTIKSATGENVLFHTFLKATGYNFFYLMGAGDHWSLISTGDKAWYPIARKDDTQLGAVIHAASAKIPCGGFLLPNGTTLNRSDYPWLYDFAYQSGSLVAAGTTARDGCFTTGDGSTTFAVPDLRGYFLRALDGGRGVDSGRIIGSWQGDAIRNIWGTLRGVYKTEGTINEGALGSSEGGPRGIVWAANNANLGVTQTVSLNASWQVPTSKENRPVNIAYPLYFKII